MGLWSERELIGRVTRWRPCARGVCQGSAQQSAAMVIVKKNCGVWLHNDTVLRLQVDDNPEPIKELRRLVEKSVESSSRARRARAGCEGVNGGPK